MENKVCSIIGHRNAENSSELLTRLYRIFESLIMQNTFTFLFGSRSSFDNICWEVITDLKAQYPNIKRIYIRAEYPYAPVNYVDSLLDYYDNTIMPESIKTAGKAAYVERNRYMIDNSDICVFYYDKDYLPQPKRSSIKNVRPYRSKSGTMLAYKYAKQKNKTVINLF